LFDQWQAELDACYQGNPRHPVFVALAETVRTFNIPHTNSPISSSPSARTKPSPVSKPLRMSSSTAAIPPIPVGHLVLYLCGYHDPERQQLSDYTCTALQLANFWQDVTVDYAKGRIYLPLEDLRQFGVTERDLAQNLNTDTFAR